MMETIQDQGGDRVTGGRRIKGIRLRWVFLVSLLVAFAMMWAILLVDRSTSGLNGMFLVAQLVNVLMLVAVVYALWQWRVMESGLRKAVWMVVILTGVGAVVFLLWEPEIEDEKLN